MGNQKFSALIQLIVLSLLGVSSLSAQTVQRITSCGTYGDAASDKVYQLDADLASSASSCINISGTSGSTRVIVDCKDPDDGTIHNITVSGTGEIFAVITQRPRVTVRNCRSNKGVRFIFQSAKYGEVLNSDLDGVEFYYGADFGVVRNSHLGGVLAGSNGLTFERNEIVGGGQHTIDTYMSGTPPDKSGHFKANPNDSRYNLIFRDNIILNNDTVQQIDGDTAVYIRVQKGSLFENNIFMSSDNATTVFMRDSANENLFVGNLFYADMPGRGALFFGSGSDTPDASGFPTEPMNNTFLRNTFRTNTGRSIRLQGPSEGNLFERNVMIANGGTGEELFTVAGATDTYRNNTFYNRATNETGLRFGESSTSTWNFNDNIVTYHSSAGALAAFGWSRTASASDMVANYNLYWNRAGSTSSDLTRFRTSVDDIPMNFSAWKSSSGKDANSPSPADPKFIDPANYNFALNSDSPARGRGSNGGDIGAFRYDNPSCTPLWHCGNWSDTCMFSKEFRSCIDLNGCNLPKPTSLATERACSSACNPNWDCSAWSACSAGVKSRTCNDINNCGVTSERPPLSWSCTAGGDTTAPASPINLQAN